MDPNTLFNYLDEGIKDRSEHVGFITQCILTPSLADILGNMFSKQFLESLTFTTLSVANFSDSKTKTRHGLRGPEDWLDFETDTWKGRRERHHR